MYQVSNSVTFGRKPIGSAEYLIQMVEALGITVDGRLKGRPCKGEKENEH